MPETAAETSFLAAEWDRFTRGWSALSPEEQSALEARSFGREGTAGAPGQINIPGWSDVVHTTPKLRPTKDQVQEYKAAYRDGRPPLLTPDVVAAIQSRQNTLDRMAASAQPGYSQAIGSMLTAVDNVQDAISTAATLGRIVVNPALAGLTHWLPKASVPGLWGALAGMTAEAASAAAAIEARAAGVAAETALRSELAALAAAGNLAAAEALAARRASSEVLGRAAAGVLQTTFAAAERRAALGLLARGLGRLIPGIGWILAAADLLNLLTWLGLGGLIGYGAVCSGVKGAAAPLIAQKALRGLPGVRPCGMKAKVGQVSDLNPFASAGRLRNAKKAARAFPGLGPLLEAAQTTDQLWGVGLSFGGIVGAVMEAAYAATGAARGTETRVNPSAVTRPLGYKGPAGYTLPYAPAVGLLERFAPRQLEGIRGQSWPALKVKWRLARVLLDAPMLLSDTHALSERDWSAALMAVCFALDTLKRDLAGADVDGLLEAAADLELTPVLAVPVDLGEQLAGLPDGGAGVWSWPLPGAPVAVSARAYVDAWAPALPAALRFRLAPMRNEAPGMFVGALVNHSNALAWQLVTGELDAFDWRFTPDYVVLSSLGDASLYAPDSAGEAALWAWWTELRTLVSVEDRRSLQPDELIESAARHGFPLIYGEQPWLRGDFLATAGV